MSPSSSNNLALPVILGAIILFGVSVLGLVPALHDKAALLHFPALIIAVFFLGVGLALWRTKSGE